MPSGVDSARGLVKRARAESRRASQTLAEAARNLEVIYEVTVSDGQTPTDLAAKVAAASSEHGSVDVLVIANTRAATAAEEM